MMATFRVASLLLAVRQTSRTLSTLEARNPQPQTGLTTQRGVTGILTCHRGSTITILAPTNLGEEACVMATSLTTRPGVMNGVAHFATHAA